MRWEDRGHAFIHKDSTKDSTAEMQELQCKLEACLEEEKTIATSSIQHTVQFHMGERPHLTICNVEVGICGWQEHFCLPVEMPIDFHLKGAIFIRLTAYSTVFQSYTVLYIQSTVLHCTLQCITIQHHTVQDNIVE